jgi:putative oxidoreductase
MQSNNSALLKDWQQTGLATIRIITGLLMAYHGWVYIGKGLELVTGICFVLGLFTRVAALLMVLDMLFICFKVGNGRFWYEDQHPFIFALLALLFFFTGPVKWSIDLLRFKNKQ